MRPLVLSDTAVTVFFFLLLLLSFLSDTFPYDRQEVVEQGGENSNLPQSIGTFYSELFNYYAPHTSPAQHDTHQLPNFFFFCPPFSR